MKDVAERLKGVCCEVNEEQYSLLKLVVISKGGACEKFSGVFRGGLGLAAVYWNDEHGQLRLTVGGPSLKAGKIPFSGFLARLRGEGDRDIDGIPSKVHGIIHSNAASILPVVADKNFSLDEKLNHIKAVGVRAVRAYIEQKAGDRTKDSSPERLTYLSGDGFVPHEGRERLTDEEYALVLPVFERNGCASLLFQEPALRDAVHDVIRVLNIAIARAEAEAELKELGITVRIIN